MSTPYLAQILGFGGNFAPRGYAMCDGQLISIAQNTALFALLGTTFGGNGFTTFALPDLRGRVPIQNGQGPGLSDYSLGQSGGVESVTLTASEMPSHIHGVGAAASGPASAGPQDSVPAADAAGGSAGFSSGVANTVMNSGMVAGQGSSVPHENRSPYLAIHYVIATEGIFPSRN